MREGGKQTCSQKGESALVAPDTEKAISAKEKMNSSPITRRLAVPV
jgi:hypothetical protein